MPDKFTVLTPELHAYAIEHSTHRDELMRALTLETEKAAGEMAIMQTAPEQAALMTVLVRSLGVSRALELGTFTGFGSIAIARGLPEDGLLLTCDVSEEWTAVARRYWEQAGLADRIELRLGPALETLAALDGSDPFDFAFIDADKPGYPDYYEECLRLMRPGGLIMVDNVFAGGQVLADLPDEDWARSVEAIRELNDRITSDDRVESAMTPIADGVTFAVKV